MNNSKLSMMNSIKGKNIWEDSLKIKNMDLRTSLRSELAIYEELDQKELDRRFEVCKKEINKEWHEKGKKVPLKFYQDTRWYLYDLTLFHINYDKHIMLSALISFLKKKRVNKILDFGAGIGSMGIVLTKQGFNTTMADISKTLLQYADFRFQIRDIMGNFIDTSDSVLPSKEFDAIFSSDVFEHLESPIDTIKELYSALKLGGYLIFNITDTGKEKTHPMHITLPCNIFYDIRSLGFKKLCTEEGLHFYQKTKRTSFSNKFIKIIDGIYYLSKFKVKILLDYLKSKKYYGKRD